MRRLGLCLLTAVAAASLPAMQGQYLAPGQYLRRLPSTQPPAPSTAGLPPGPTITAPPTLVPTASAAETAKAASEKEATLKRVIEFQKKRALGGSASAQYNLGVRYLEGEGVAKDLAEACKWLRAAAKQDYTWAKRKLVELEKEHGTLPPTVELEPATASRPADGNEAAATPPPGEPPASPTGPPAPRP
jgi:TPR repeat protein